MTMQAPTTEQKTAIAQMRGLSLKMEIFKSPQAFLTALRKVYGCGAYPDFKSTYRIKRLCEDLEKECQKHLQDLENSFIPVKTIMEAHKAIVEKGEEVTPAQLKELEDAKAKHMTDVSVLRAGEVPFKWDGLTEAEINCVKGISPADLSVLEHIMAPEALGTLLQ